MVVIAIEVLCLAEATMEWMLRMGVRMLPLLPFVIELLTRTRSTVIYHFLTLGNDNTVDCNAV